MIALLSKDITAIQLLHVYIIYIYTLQKTWQWTNNNGLANNNSIGDIPRDLPVKHKNMSFIPKQN